MLNSILRLVVVWKTRASMRICRVHSQPTVVAKPTRSRIKYLLRSRSEELLQCSHNTCLLACA